MNIDYKVLNETITTMEHLKHFIGSSNKMQKTGLELFDDCLNDLKTARDNALVFNNGVCKSTCNCVEIEQIKRNGEIKSYPCLKP